MANICCLCCFPFGISLPNPLQRSEATGVLMVTADIFIMSAMRFYASLKALAVEVQGFSEHLSSQLGNLQCVAIFLVVKSLQT